MVGTVTAFNCADTGLGPQTGIRACLVDLVGDLIDTTKAAAAVREGMFDDYLKAQTKTTGTTFVDLESVADDGRHVDGRVKVDRTTSFPRSREIDLPQGYRRADRLADHHRAR